MCVMTNMMEMNVKDINSGVIDILEGIGSDMVTTDETSKMWLFKRETISNSLDDSGLDDSYEDSYKTIWSIFAKQFLNSQAAYLLIKQ